MATREVTLSLEADAIALAEEAARRAGVSTSAWLSRAARREAVRTGYAPPAATLPWKRPCNRPWPTTPTERPPRSGCVRRGELWAYAPQGVPRQRRVVVVSSDGINESARPWLLAVEVLEDDPGDILAVPVPDLGWVYAGSASRAYRRWLTEHLGGLEPETMETIDGALRAALDL